MFQSHRSHEIEHWLGMLSERTSIILVPYLIVKGGGSPALEATNSCRSSNSDIDNGCPVAQRLGHYSILAILTHHIQLQEHTLSAGGPCTWYVCQPIRFNVAISDVTTERPTSTRNGGKRSFFQIIVVTLRPEDRPYRLVLRATFAPGLWARLPTISFLQYYPERKYWLYFITSLNDTNINFTHRITASKET